MTVDGLAPLRTPGLLVLVEDLGYLLNHCDMPGCCDKTWSLSDDHLRLLTSSELSLTIIRASLAPGQCDSDHLSSCEEVIIIMTDPSHYHAELHFKCHYSSDCGMPLRRRRGSESESGAPVLPARARASG